MPQILKEMLKCMQKIIGGGTKTMENKPMSEKEREGLELFRQHMERVEKMSPKERAEHDKEVDALLKWMLPPGHMWHTADEDDEE